MSVSKKQPNCPYGNPAKYICVNSQCKKPGLICEKGQNIQSQCWLFHEKCAKARWAEIQAFSRENSASKTPEFKYLQDKIQNLISKALEKIQSEHQKFKMWVKTLGHNLETMKFIKILTDKNYEMMTGEYLSTMMPLLLNKQGKRVQIPNINEHQFQLLQGDIEKVLQKLSNLYLRTKRPQKPPLYSQSTGDMSDSHLPLASICQPHFARNNNFSGNHFSHFHKYSQGSYFSPSNNSQRTYQYYYNNNSDFLSPYTNSNVPFQNNNPQVSSFHPKDYSKQANVTNSGHIENQISPSHFGEFNSKILDSLTGIESYFQRKIKNTRLIFRASQHNFSTKMFHELCDDISNTLILVHNQFDKKFGGFTPLAWTSTKKQWMADKSLKSFIFSIDMKQKFKLNLAQFAIAANPERGPTFGCCDICIVDNSNRQKSNCEFPISYNNNGKYVRSQNTSQLLTGNLKGQFYIKEWQVFKLQFE